MTPPPPGLTREAIARLVPHQGTMLLLAGLESWDATTIRCTATDHRDPAHPLRSASGLLATAAIELAAQAMALHGALAAAGDGRPQRPGYLASVRDVAFARVRLDDLPPAEPDALRIWAERLAGDGERVLYRFAVSHGAIRIAGGRAAVVLDTPIAA